MFVPLTFISAETRLKKIQPLNNALADLLE